MVQRAIVVMPALKTSCKLTRISQDGHSANDLLRLYSALKSLSILVIISGICQGLEIEGITVATLQMTYESMTSAKAPQAANFLMRRGAGALLLLLLRLHIFTLYGQ